MYELGFDGITKESKIVDNKLVASGPAVNILATTRKFYTNKGIAPPDLLGLHIKAMKEHYLALSQKFNIRIGAEHSWINTR